MSERVKVVYFSPAIIHDWIVQDAIMPSETVRCAVGIPADAIFQRGFYDAQRNCYGAIYYHPDWPEIERGQEYPEIRVTMVREL